MMAAPRDADIPACPLAPGRWPARPLTKYLSGEAKYVDVNSDDANANNLNNRATAPA
jgi:hypothetical protein